MLLKKIYLIELLRFISSFSVIIYHYDIFFFRFNNFNLLKISHENIDRLPFGKILDFIYEHGDYGIHIFWTISGFVISYVYFDRIKKLTNENLTRTDSLLRESLIKVDSLRQVYMRVMLEESKKEFTGTSIDLGGSKTTTKEIELFSTDIKINEELGLIAVDIGEKSEVINVISNFQTIGYEIKGITKNYIFILAGLSFFITLLVILFIDLNNYLSTYKKKS